MTIQSLPVAVLIGLLGVSLLLTLAWLIQLATRNAGVVDTLWSWAVGGLGVWFAAVGPAPAQLRGLLGLMAGVWGFRLGLHLLIRNHGKPEDGRYKRFRDEWGARANYNLFWFFQLQAVFALLLAVGFIVVAWSPVAPGPLWIAGAVLLWLLSVVGEALADAQLERFKRDPANRGRVCRRGLWRYSRHPNYFFECLHWLAYLLLASASSWWWLALLPPAVMWFLLMRLSGIPLTEAQAARTRPEYADYIRRTSALIPWPPRRG